MAKLKGPLFSLEAHGSIGDELTFSKRKSGNQVRFQRKQKDVITADRTIQRDAFKSAPAVWAILADSIKSALNVVASLKNLTGYNFFVQSYLKTDISSVGFSTNYRVAHYGDSLTNYGGLAPVYPPYLPVSWTKVEGGVAAETATQIATRVVNDLPDELADTQTIFFLGGTNDLEFAKIFNSADYDTFVASAMFAGVTTMVNAVLAANKKLVLCVPPPTLGDTPLMVEKRANILAYYIANFTDPDVVILDLTSTPWPASMFEPDGTHTSEAGAQYIAWAISAKADPLNI
jgi:lysophospholipase L1-like esterase